MTLLVILLVCIISLLFIYPILRISSIISRSEELEDIRLIVEKL